MLIGYFMIVLLLCFFVVVGVIVLILVIDIIVVILLVMRIVLKRVKTRECKFNILIIMTKNVTYIGIL